MNQLSRSIIHNAEWEEPLKDGRGVVYCPVITQLISTNIIANTPG